MAKQKFLQRSFSGGVNQQVDSTRIGDNEIPLIINARNRYDIIDPVKLPLLIDDSNFPVGGKYQGIVAAENTLVVFINGMAYYKDYSIPNSYYRQIPNFLMSDKADIIYTALVPKSYFNFSRQPQEDMINTGVDFMNPIEPSANGIVVQDGLNQPWFIDTTMNARVLQNYGQWDVAGNREYVPVGLQMLFHDGVLYIVSSDGTQLFRSVTGRPLDFMVNITFPDGDKESSEVDGGAATVSHSVDFDKITAIAPLSTDDGAFFVATARSSYAVTPDFDDVLFNEPTFINRFLFDVGCVSPFSVIEMLGDYAFVDFNGLRSFNAVLQIKNAGRNSPFSKKLGPILQSIQQDYVSAINFDNYAMFAVNTVYGRGIILYDTLLDCFAGVDIYPDVGQIRQFGEIKTSQDKRLFAMTQTGLYEMFASDNYAQSALYIGDWCSNDPEMDQHPSLLKIVFVDAEQGGTVYATSYVDRKLNKTLSSALIRTNTTQMHPPLIPPFGQETTDTVQTLNFDFGRSLQGWRVGFFIEWDFKAKISHVSLESEVESNVNSIQTAARQFSSNLAALNSAT